MSMNPYSAYAAGLKNTPQTEPIPEREAEMVANNAGGFGFAISKWARMERFLVLGTDGGTYYTNAAKLTQENASAVIECIKEDGLRAVQLIRDVSHDGRAIRNDPALFALALAATHGDTSVKRAALNVLPEVARIGTHIFHFAQYVQSMRGWGRALKTAVARWYDGKSPDSLAYQVIKYRQRDGWSHKDLLALSHPRDSRNAFIYDWVMQGGADEDRPGRWIGDENAQARERNIVTTMPIPQMIEGFLKVQEIGATNLAETKRLIYAYKLPREALPTEVLKDPGVWEALLSVDMGLEAMVRNLGVMSANGLLKPMSDAASSISERLHDAEAIKRARLHPMKILIGSKIYAEGKGDKGSLTWKPVPKVIDALNDAFYLAFGAVEPSNKRTMLALDISGSMGSVRIAGAPLTAREGSCAMALVTANVEPRHMFGAFTTNFVGLDFSPRERLEHLIRKTAALTMGATDCAQPMLWAQANKMEVDNFIIYTDNETYAGRPHPSQALADYRKKMGIPGAKLSVVGMTSTGFSIADPKDPGMMDFVGFDTDTPAALAAFAR